jgi:acetyl-CoA decarbonylase/synthase complex subunit gamma
MGLTALEIYKHLPKTNCGACKVPTCLAFAMKIAQMKGSIEECPHASAEVKAKLSESSAPPIKLVKVGTGAVTVEMGDETVIFRHEKTFFHPTAFAGVVRDTDPDIGGSVSKIDGMRWERIGMVMSMNLVAVRNGSGDPAKFAAAAKAAGAATKLPLVLMSSRPEAIEAALKEVCSCRPLIHGATKDNFDAMVKLAVSNKLPLVVLEGSSLEALGALAEKAKAAGVEELVLDFGPQPLSKAIQHATAIRRLAIKKSNRAFGYPTFLSVKAGEEASMGALGVMKYAGTVAFEQLDPAMMYPLMTLRQNIYTDPQKPIRVKAGVYDVGGETGPASPLLFTTNFSLTYFTVEGDVIKSKVPARVLVLDTDGLSVMTSFAAGKLTPELVAKALEDNKLAENVPSKTIVLPGLVARMKGKLEELSGWKAIVGPRDSSGIPKFLKEYAGQS